MAHAYGTYMLIISSIRSDTSCSAPYPPAGEKDEHEGPPQGGGSEPDAAAALLGLWLARDKDGPVQARARLYTERSVLRVPKTIVYETFSKPPSKHQRSAPFFVSKPVSKSMSHYLAS